MRIRNFRGIRDLELELGDTTVLIGENNCGKTTVLDALRLCLQEPAEEAGARFDRLDFHLADEHAEPRTAPPIMIEVHLAEEHKDQWGWDVRGQLRRLNVLLSGSGGAPHVALQVSCRYNPDAGGLTQRRGFIDDRGGLVDAATVFALLGGEVSCYYLTALRDAARHFRPEGHFWAPFLHGSQLRVDRKEEVEAKLSAANQAVVSSHAGFGRVAASLNRVRSVVRLTSGEAVAIEALPQRMFEMLERAQVRVATEEGVKLPLERHGEGTQSLAVLMLFSAFLDSRAGGTALLALEEPEAHLHPSATRALSALLGEFAGQQVMSTHSGELLAETDVSDLRRLARSGEGIRAFQVRRGRLSPEAVRKFNHSIRRTRGELLFARCWLLVEGETECWIFPAAARALGMNLHREGVQLVEFRQSDSGMLTKVANALGIAWFCVGDADDNREREEARLRGNLAGAEASDRFAFPYLNIEAHLTEHGYADVYRRVRRKTRAAAEVAAEMEIRGAAGVTEEIRSVLDKAVSLAKGGWR